jgi:photosystem II stability/assembly factor-like uncharacterized protein
MELLSLAVSILLLSPHWTLQTSGVTARLRGVSAVSDRVAWTSGSGSTVLRTTDGGVSWQKVSVTEDRLDFRDVDAIDANTAYVLSIGNGPQSRIYKTNDGGQTWQLQFKNQDPKAFLDAMTFWDATHGVAFGDSVDHQFYILTTENGGALWSRVDPNSLPPALENEGAFAASGTNIAVLGKTHAWIGTGAASNARVLRTTNGGRSWQIATTPLNSEGSAGIFSIAFRDEKHGVVAGGDYTKEKESNHNLAVTSDGGATWTLVSGLSGFRSAVAYVPGSKTLVAVGPAGGDYSNDDGKTWTSLEGPGFDTLSFARGKSVAWASGAQGILARLTFE